MTPIPSLVVVTTVDGTLLDPVTRSCSCARAAIDLLSARSIPIVLSSHHSAGELLRVQEELGILHPFICGNGAALHVPTGYFATAAGDARSGGLALRQGDWQVIECPPPRPPAAITQHVEPSAHAIRLLLALYRVHHPDALIIVVGSEWDDRVLLREADVPIVVRRDGCEQARILRSIPSAYFTDRPGPEGWSEAILGAAEA